MNQASTFQWCRQPPRLAIRRRFHARPSSTGIPSYILAVLALLLSASARASAHPHIFFDLDLEIKISSGEEMRALWTLHPNEATCMAMFMEAESDGDNVIGEEELKQLSDRWEQYFTKFRFFVTARSDGNAVEPAVLEWIGMEVVDRPGDFPFFRFSFAAKFEMPPRQPGDHALELDLTDETYYAAFFQNKKGSTFEPVDGRIEPRSMKILSHGRGVCVDYSISALSDRDIAAEDQPLPPKILDVAQDPESGSGNLRARFNDQLRKGMDWLSSKVLDLSKGFRLGAFLAFMGFALLYGMFHALGPGHGKALVAAFLLRGDGKASHALLLSIVVAMTHTGTAVLIAGVLKLAGTQARGEEYREVTQAWVGLASGILVMLIGFYPVLSAFWVRLIGKKAEAGADLDEAASALEEKTKNEYQMTLARVGRWGVAAGLVPCPASLVILFISMGAGVFWLGLLAVASLAVGLSTVLLIIGLGVVYSRRGILSRLSDSRRLASAQAFLSVAGGLVVVVLGALLASFYIDRLGSLGGL